ncbi:MAG: Phenylalanine--tRNA ligase [Bacteroidota bacterium]
MQDTFFIEKGAGEIQDDVLLRTHTSNVQIRLMQHQKPPIRSVMPGRVFKRFLPAHIAFSIKWRDFMWMKM